MRSAIAIQFSWYDRVQSEKRLQRYSAQAKFHPTVMVFDEAAFLPGFEAGYNAVHPVAFQIISISSAGPGFSGICALAEINMMRSDYRLEP